MRLDVHPFTSLGTATSWAIDQIDQAAGAARARYITIAPGQDVTYQAKYADALAFARAGYPDAEVDQYPWVRAEADATNASSRDAADSIKAVGDPWNAVIGPRIESLRIGGKRALESMASIAEVVSHVRNVKGQLDAA